MNKSILFFILFFPLTLVSQIVIESISPYGKVVKGISIEGLEKTKEYIVIRELQSKVGQPCLEQNMVEEYAHLDILDIFSEIIIKPTVENDSVHIHYQFVETFSLLPTISMQITDENGFSGGGGIKFPNLFGRDIYLSARALFGGATTIEVTVYQPWLAWDHVGYRLDYFHRDRYNKAACFNEKADEVYLKMFMNINKYWKTGINYELVVLDSDVPNITLSPTNTDQIFRAGLFFELDTRDGYMDTRSGWWNEIAYTHEVKIITSNSNFHQVDIDLRKYIPLKCKCTHWHSSHLRLCGVGILVKMLPIGSNSILAEQIRYVVGNMLIEGVKISVLIHSNIVIQL
jgi:outer membrane protein assembly factor BamA